MKQCRGCGKWLDLSAYYKQSSCRDGHQHECKECTKERARVYRADTIEERRAFDRARAMLPHRVAAREAYEKTHRGRIALARAKEKWRSLNEMKRAAHILLGNAVRSGRIEKGVCEVCGDGKRTHAHHDDYSKPLEVRWFCPMHHKLFHKHVEETA